MTIVQTNPVIISVGNLVKEGSVVDGRQTYIQTSYMDDGKNKSQFSQKFSVAQQDCDKFEKIMEEKKALSDKLNEKQAKNPNALSPERISKMMKMATVITSVVTAVLGIFGGLKIAKSAWKFPLAAILGVGGAMAGAFTGLLASIYAVPGVAKTVKLDKQMSKIDVIGMTPVKPEDTIIK